MKTLNLFFLLLTLLAVPLKAQDAAWMATRPVVAYAESKGGLNSDKKAKLRLIAAGGSVNPSFFIDARTRLQVLSTGQFDVREMLPDRVRQEAFKEMKVIYSCALVQPLDGRSKDLQGWVVLSREVVGQYKDVFIEPPVAE